MIVFNTVINSVHAKRATCDWVKWQGVTGRADNGATVFGRKESPRANDGGDAPKPVEAWHWADQGFLVDF